MKLFQKLKIKQGKGPNPDGKDTVACILAELERRRAERLPFELQWRLNAAFLGGAQRCEIDTARGRLEENEPLYEYEERGVYNRIAPLMDTRLANLKSVSFNMGVRPATQEGDDLQKAHVCSELLKYTYLTGEFEHKKNTLLQWAELTGSAFLLSSWDKNGGTPLSQTEEGEPVMTGELKYTLLSPYEVFPENLYRQEMGEQGSVIIEQILGAKEIRSLYGVECNGRDMTAAVLQAPPGGGDCTSVGSALMRDSERVVTYLEAPSKENPQGAVVQIAAGQLVYAGELPIGVMPLTVFRVKENAGQFFGKSVIEDLIPLQRAYNGCKNKIHDYISTLAANSMLVEEGSMDVDQMEENGTAPGAALIYKRGYTPPTPLHHEAMPPEVYAECEQLCRDMEYVAGVSQLMVVGASATGVTSGKAINYLREIDSTRMALCAENMRAGALESAKLWLQMYKKHCPGVMTLKITGQNSAGAVFTWCADDINSFDVYFCAENQLRMSEQARRAAFFEAYDRGLFNDENGSLPQWVKTYALSLVTHGDGGMPMGEPTLQQGRAERENALFATGSVMPKLGPLDDHAVHIRAHRCFALDAAFENIAKRDGTMAEAFYRHIKEHEEAAKNEAEQKTPA